MQGPKNFSEDSWLGGSQNSAAEEKIRPFRKKFGPFCQRYCPARWIWLKVGSFDRSSLKSEAQRFKKKSVHPPSCESPLKFRAPGQNLGVDL
jgi:hypothetical protein